MKRDPYTVLIRPVITEDAMDRTSLREPQYTFRVAPDANKIEIARAIEAAFDVRVKCVNVLRQPGKPKRMRGHSGRSSGYKKAFITLEEGQRINII